MARKPTDRRQRSLFSSGSGDLPEPPDDLTIQPQGGHHAVQDDHSRNVATRPRMHDQLRKSRKLLPTLELYARELKTSHEAWKEMLAQLRPDSDQTQIASEALEMALKEMEDRLPSDSQRGTSAQVLDAAMLSSAVPRRAAKSVTTTASLFDGVSDDASRPPVRGVTGRQPPARQAETRFLLRASRTAPPTGRWPSRTSAAGSPRQRREIQGPRHTRRHPHPKAASRKRSGPPRPKNSKPSPASAGFGPVALSIFPDPVTAATRTPAGRPSAKN